MFKSRTKQSKPFALSVEAKYPTPTVGDVTLCKGAIISTINPKLWNDLTPSVSGCKAPPDRPPVFFGVGRDDPD